MTTYSYTALKGFFPEHNPDLTVHPTSCARLMVQLEQALTPLSGSWQSLMKALIDAQNDGPEGCEIKLLLIMRHCQGGHNAMCDLHIPKDHGLSPKGHRLKMREIGRHYPLFDPGLSPKGEQQAVQLSSFVQKLFEQGMPAPKHFTWAAVWDNRHATKGGKQDTALVIEGLREKIHVHLCNARQSTSALLTQYPQLTVLPDTPEQDPIWQPGLDCHYERSDIRPPQELMNRPMRERETEEEMYVRAEQALEHIMRNGRGEHVISLTSHSSLLMELLRVLGAESRELNTGVIVPVVVGIRMKQPR